MSAGTAQRPASDASAPALLPLPERPPRFAPVTRALLLRGVVLPGALVLLAATALIFAVPSSAATAAGLSLLVPGGGLLYAGQPLLFVLWLVLFGAALVLWWGVSAVAAPIVVVVAGAGVSALVAPPEASAWSWSVPVMYAVFVAAAVIPAVRSEVRHRRKVALIPELNAFLETATPPERSLSRQPSTELDSRMLGFLLETGLQPLDRFEGFDHGEQYHGGTCLRYQLTTIGTALAMAGTNLLPNYPGLVGEAQRNIVRKQLDPRVWKYWQLENVLGNFSTDPDPIRRDNIMFSGFLLSHLGEFEAATGYDDFDEPGSLTFVWRDGRRFVYDHETLARAVAENFRTAELGIFPCEPGWVFTVCNAMAAQGLASHAVAHRGGLWDEVLPTWRRGVFEEMMTPDGGIRHIRSTLAGFTFNDGEGTGEYYTSGNHNFESTAPDLARRGAVLRMRGVAEKIAALEGLIDDDGALALTLAPRREKGTRYLSALTEWLGIAAGALAVGNDRVAQAALRSIERDCGTGGVFPARPLDGGMMMQAALMSIVWGAPESPAELVQRGYRAPHGPILESAPWPEILVSRAVSPDGRSLDLVVEPHRAAPGAEHPFVFVLPESGPARLTGDGVDLRLVPDARGRVDALIRIDSRLALTLTPEEETR